MKTSISIIGVLFLFLFCFIAEESCKKNKDVPIYQEISDALNSTLHKIEDVFDPYVCSHGDPYASKPTFCNAQSCGGCSDKPFENINNCVGWCRAPCLCISLARGRGDDIVGKKSRRRRANMWWKLYEKWIVKFRRRSEIRIRQYVIVDSAYKEGWLNDINLIYRQYEKSYVRNVKYFLIV